MSNEKPMELTEAELDALTEAGEVALPNRALVAAIVDDLVPAIIRIVEAREAAARREALLEAKRTMCAECASRVDEQEER